MTSSRLEAFSDDVLAIIITIMVLELKVPHGAEWSALYGIVLIMAGVANTIYVGVAVIWLVPDQRIEPELVP